MCVLYEIIQVYTVHKLELTSAKGCKCTSELEPC